MNNTKLWATLLACLGVSFLFGQVTLDFTKTPTDGGTAAYISQESLTANGGLYNVNIPQAIEVDPVTGDTTLLMWPGDVNGDGLIRYTQGNDFSVFPPIPLPNDAAAILDILGSTSATINGYFNHDVNLDGMIRYTQGNDFSVFPPIPLPNDAAMILDVLGSTSRTLKKEF